MALCVNPVHWSAVYLNRGQPADDNIRPCKLLPTKKCSKVTFVQLYQMDLAQKFVASEFLVYESMLRDIFSVLGLDSG